MVDIRKDNFSRIDINFVAINVVVNLKNFTSAFADSKIADVFFYVMHFYHGVKTTEN